MFETRNDQNTKIAPVLTYYANFFRTDAQFCYIFNVLNILMNNNAIMAKCYQ